MDALYVYIWAVQGYHVVTLGSKYISCECFKVLANEACAFESFLSFSLDSLILMPMPPPTCLESIGPDMLAQRAEFHVVL